MPSKYLMISLAGFVILASAFLINWYSQVSIKPENIYIFCTGENRRLEIGQTGEKWCRELLPDRGKICTASNQCLSGYCMTLELKAKTGKCYESKTGDSCLWGVTIEEAQKSAKPSGKTKMVFSPCVY